MNPAVSLLASPSGLSPNPLMWEWGAMREDWFGDRVVVDKGALCAGGGAPDVDAFMVICGRRTRRRLCCAAFLMILPSN